jgi:hypothetical protein
VFVCNIYVIGTKAAVQDNSSNIKIKASNGEGEAMPLIKQMVHFDQQNGLLPDMQFGWKPEIKTSHPPIPLYFDFIEHNYSPYNFGEDIEKSDVVVYQEQRFADSYKMHKKYANKQLFNGHQSYKFNFPKNHENGRFVDDGLLSKIFGSKKLEKDNDIDEFTGMNPECIEFNKKLPLDQDHKFLTFDGSFESGNIDVVIKTYPQESYDIYLRPDSNTRGYF